MLATVFLEQNNPTVAHFVCFLPPEGAVAPAARQSRFRGPCLKKREAATFVLLPLF